MANLVKLEMFKDEIYMGLFKDGRAKYHILIMKYGEDVTNKFWDWAGYKPQHFTNQKQYKEWLPKITDYLHVN